MCEVRNVDEDTDLLLRHSFPTIDSGEVVQKIWGLNPKVRE